MPMRVRKPCNHPGCPALTTEAYCQRHRPLRDHSYDDHRGTAAERGYGSRWQRYRLCFLQLHPLCINFSECRNAAELVDHIEPVSSGGSFWDPSNHQPMCRPCHSRKTAGEDGGFGNAS